MNFVNTIDNTILKFVENNMHTSILDKLMVFITTLGNGGLVWIVTCAFLILNKKYRKIGIIALASLVVSAFLGEGIIKNIVQRVRPTADVMVVASLIVKPLSYSFPSGHSASAFAVAGVLSYYFKKYAVCFYTMAVLIAFSRIYLYVHYPSDVAGGIILGLLCSRLAIFVANKIKFLNRGILNEWF